jgi:hypothetical protein
MFLFSRLPFFQIITWRIYFEPHQVLSKLYCDFSSSQVKFSVMSKPISVKFHKLLTLFYRQLKLSVIKESRFYNFQPSFQQELVRRSSVQMKQVHVPDCEKKPANCCCENVSWIWAKSPVQCEPVHRRKWDSSVF